MVELTNRKIVGDNVEKFFSIMGGMGTLATESFIHLLNQRTPAHKDQDYLNYVLLNHATIPDRTAYILDDTKENPLPYLLADIKMQNEIGAEFIVLTCNTAHYFYETLQKNSQVPILHMPKEAVKELTKKYQGKKVAFLGTEGSIKAGVYQKEIEKAGFCAWIPPQAIQEKVNYLIYHEIKERGLLNTGLYLEILKEVTQTHGCGAVILGCTELSLIEDKTENHNYPVFDAQSILVDRTLERALSERKS